MLQKPLLPSAHEASLNPPLLRPIAVNVPKPMLSARRHVNIVCASMARGGAERMIVELATAWEEAQYPCKVIVFNNHKPAYELKSGNSMVVVPLHTFDRSVRAEVAAQEIICSPQMLAYTILIRESDLQTLWRFGIATAPVVVNSAEGWQDPPTVYNHPKVPFVVAVSDFVADQLRTAGLKRPVHVIRHEILKRKMSQSFREARQQIRSRFGIPDDMLLIGMIGQFKAQKSYPRAVRVLKAVQRHRAAKLMIVGGWSHSFGLAKQTYEATIRQALNLGCISDLIVTGNVDDAESYYCAFDAFLNTSIYEGLSIATLEAQAFNCPIVISDAGGQRELLRGNDVLVSKDGDADAYAVGIIDTTRIARPHPDVKELANRRSIVPHLWQYLSAASSPLPMPRHRPRTLFITANLNIGGAQRSLVNLISRLIDDADVYLAVLNHLTFDGFYQTVKAMKVPTLFIGLGRSFEARTFELISVIQNLGIDQIVFWNADPMTKLVLTKSFAHTKLQIIDVSPGPMLFEELAQVAEFQNKIAFSQNDYFKRLNRFVTKYRAGFQGYDFDRSKVAVVRNGIDWRLYGPGKSAEATPENVEPHVLTVTRIVPNKQLELLIDMMKSLRGRIPNTVLTIVGGVEQRHIGYWETLAQRIESGDRNFIRFAGPASDIRPFLRTHRVFVMMSKGQGCPNASLEAMAAGLPVIANDDGGTAEQVVHGGTGFIVRSNNPEEMARRVYTVLKDPLLAAKFGAAGRRRVKRLFGMERMVRGYKAVLGLS